MTSDRDGLEANKTSQLERVREGRVELPRPFGHRILSPARLPFRHSRGTEPSGQRLRGRTVRLAAPVMILRA